MRTIKKQDAERMYSSRESLRPLNPGERIEGGAWSEVEALWIAGGPASGDTHCVIENDGNVEVSTLLRNGEGVFYAVADGQGGETVAQKWRTVPSALVQVAMKA